MTTTSLDELKRLFKENILIEFTDKSLICTGQMPTKPILDLIESHEQLQKRFEEAVEVIKWYGDDKKYFDRPITVNLQNTTAVWHVDEPEKLPTEFKTTTPEVSARLKMDRGRKARKFLASLDKEK